MQQLRDRWSAWTTGRQVAVLAGIVVVGLVLIVAISGDPEPRDLQGDAGTPVAAATDGLETSEAAGDPGSDIADPSEEPTPAIADARAAVDAGDYAEAMELAESIGPAAERAIEGRIANRAARAAERALARGDRQAASRALRRAADLPSTKAFASAQSDLRAAQARASARRAAERQARAARRAAEREARRVAREQARAAAKAEAAAEAAAEESAAGPDCHPSYEGACLDPSSPDYDCSGGSGDGPDYTGPVTVVGPDEYDLDRDGNGAGCES